MPARYEQAAGNAAETGRHQPPDRLGLASTNVADRRIAPHLCLLPGSRGTRIMRFPLATSSWDENERRAMQDVIASDHFSMGAKVQQFEADFARYVGSRHCVMCNSGSSANLLMIAALRYTKNDRLRLQPGDEVIVRSEEHTSELQSLMRISYAVFCLKKKTQDKVTNEE